MAPREDADLKNAGDLRQPTLRLRVDVAAAGHAAVGIETVEKDVAAQEKAVTDSKNIRWNFPKFEKWPLRDGHFTFVVAAFGCVYYQYPTCRIIDRSFAPIFCALCYSTENCLYERIPLGMLTRGKLDRWYHIPSPTRLVWVNQSY